MYKYINGNYQELGFNKLYDDVRIYWYPNAKAIIYHQKDESDLIKDHPFLIKYVNENHTMEQFLNKTLSNRQPIKIDDIPIVEMENVISIAVEEISDNQEIFAKGEDEFGNFINEIISDLANAAIENIILKLNDIDGIFINHKEETENTKNREIRRVWWPGGLWKMNYGIESINKVIWEKNHKEDHPKSLDQKHGWFF